MDNPKSKIVMFLVLALALSAIGWIPIIRAGTLAGGGGLWVLAVMWSPAIAAILTRLVTQHNVRGIGWIPRTPKLLGLAYVLPLLYAAPVYLLVWTTGIAGFNAGKWAVQAGLTPVSGLVLLATVGVIASLISALGEEIGWRGLLVPELAKVTNFRNTALISGVIWASWHMPLVFGADYHGKGTPVAYSVVCFTAMVMATSFIMAWIRLKSNSVWPAALLHATHNLFVQGVFDLATVDKASTGWWTGEFGAGLAITITVAAFLLTRFSKVEGTVQIGERPAAVDRAGPLNSTTT